MLLGKSFEKFINGSPVTVMLRGIIEWSFHAERFDQLFEQHAQKQYRKDLPFSTVAEVIGEVVFNTQPSVGAGLQARAGELPVSRKAFYNKLNGVEPQVAAALVVDSAQQFLPVLEKLTPVNPPLLPGYEVRLLDGNHFAATEHRLDVLRGETAVPLPGQALAVLDPDRRLVVDVIPCEDAHAQERTLLPDVLNRVQPGEVWIADRNFCTLGFLSGIMQCGGRFLIRHHANMPYETAGKRKSLGRTATGHVSEQSVRVTDPETGRVRKVRMIIVELDDATRDEDTVLRLLTNLPARDASAARVAELYRHRWTIETMFQKLTEHLTCEIKTLAYPQAAVLAFCLSLVAWNALSVVLSALASAQGAETVRETVSGYYLSLEISQVYHGMMIAVPSDEWKVFRGLTPSRLAQELKRLARHVDLTKYQKHPRGAKTPQPPRRYSGNGQHVATARLLCRKT